ncbi:alpha-2-antiplasmin-like isoform X2 [Anguilla rostrata]
MVTVWKHLKHRPLHRLSFTVSQQGIGQADKRDMDLRLLALLLLCLCRQGLTDPTAEDPSTPGHGPALNASSPNGEDSLEKVEEEVKDGEGEKESCTAEELSPEAKREVGAAILKLGLQLLENLKTGPEQPNVIISPLSVSLALSQLALGAASETEKLLLQTLKADDLPCYHQSLRSLLQHLRNSTVKIATRIYLEAGFKVKPEFIQQSLRTYDSEPALLAGREEINQWVQKATDGHMTDFLLTLPPNLVLMLINAVHFKGEWVARFDPALTAKDRFYIDSKNIVDVDMMVGHKYPLSLLMDGELGAQVASFPFKANMSLLVVMPMSGKVNVSAIAAKLNTSDLYARLPSEKAMQVKLPKFKLEYGQELEDALTSMGLGSLFSAPDLSGITDSPLVVSSVQHKSSMELHEEGAEASAATAVSTTRANLSFSVNQPFLFALLDDATQTPIFLGVIRNPDPGATAMQNDDPERTGRPDHGHSDSSDDLPK